MIVMWRGARSLVQAPRLIRSGVTHGDGWPQSLLAPGVLRRRARRAGRTYADSRARRYAVDGRPFVAALRAA
jgi:hypothetical protein